MNGRRVALAAALLVAFAACTRQRLEGAAGSAGGATGAAVAAAGEKSELRVGSHGAVSVLVVAATRLTFCDADGLRALELPTGRVLAAGGACPAGTIAPRPTGPEVTVRTPGQGPDDIVEIDGEGRSFPIEGHARDWASDAGQVVVVATGTQVLSIRPAANQRVTLSAQGAERVAVGGGWAAWWDGAVVVARRL